jgi:hypothetical protein
VIVRLCVCERGAGRGVSVFEEEEGGDQEKREGQKRKPSFRLRLSPEPPISCLLLPTRPTPAHLQPTRIESLSRSSGQSSKQKSTNTRAHQRELGGALPRPRRAYARAHLFPDTHNTTTMTTKTTTRTFSSSQRQRRRTTTLGLLLLLAAAVCAAAIAPARASAAALAAAAASADNADLETWLDEGSGEDDVFAGGAGATRDEVEEASAALAGRAASAPSPSASSSSSPPTAPPPPPRPRSSGDLQLAKARATAAAYQAAARAYPASPPLMTTTRSQATVWFYAIVGLVMTTLMVGLKETGASLLLEGLTVLRLRTAAPSAADDASASASTRKRRAAAQQAAQAGGGQTVSLEPLGAVTLGQLEFKDALDLVLLYSAVAVGVALASWLSTRLAGTPPNSLPVITQACVVFYVLAELIKSELAHEAVSKNDRAAYLVMAAVGAASAGAVLAAIPPGRLTDFDAGAGGYAAGVQLHETIQRRMSMAAEAAAAKGGGAGAAGAEAAAAAQGAGGGGMMLAEEGLPAVAAWAPCMMAAALLSGGLMAPGMRYGRALLQALHPPQWARASAPPPSRLASAAARLSFFLPLAVVVLWFPPLTDALGLGRGFADAGARLALAAGGAGAGATQQQARQLATLALWRAWLVLAAGAAQLLASRALLQSFLNTGLFAWYQLRHVGLANVDDARVQAITRRQVLGALALAAKAGLQMVAPAAVLLPCGALLLLRSADDAFCAVAAGFVAWWTCLTWSFFGGLSILLGRLGSTGGIVNIS